MLTQERAQRTHTLIPLCAVFANIFESLHARVRPTQSRQPSGYPCVHRKHRVSAPWLFGLTSCDQIPGYPLPFPGYPGIKSFLHRRYSKTKLSNRDWVKTTFLKQERIPDNALSPDSRCLPYESKHTRMVWAWIVKKTHNLINKHQLNLF